MNYKTAKGWLTESERDYLYKLAKKSTTIINVGIEYGASIHCFAEGNPTANIVAIDLIGNQKFVGNLESSVAIKEEQVADLEQLLAQYQVVFIEGNSNTIDIEAEADLIFIDGGHDYKCVQNDIAKFAQMATDYLLFHDYSDAIIHSGVKKALDEWTPHDFMKIKQVDTIAVYQRVKTEYINSCSGCIC